MFAVYILKSLSRQKYYYKGQSSNLEKRLKDHLRGRCATTKDRGPWKLVHVELCDSRNEARILEKFFKSGYGREVIEEIDK